jgi:HK97 family phage prohead protease
VTADVEYRAFAPELEVRSGGDGRVVEGIAVPYNRAQRINDRLTESFVPGAFNHQLRAGYRNPLFRDHQAHGGVLIGRAIELRDDPAGLVGRWRVARTAAGDETLELIRERCLDQLSIGFREGQNRQGPNGEVQRVKAHLVETAVVINGAYGDGAAVTGVRSAACPTCGHRSVVDDNESPAVRNDELASLILAGLEYRSQSNLDNTDEGRRLWRYWLGEGAAKWVSAAHPYTALVTALTAAGVPATSVNGLAANLFREKFGMWPGERKGSNPAGRG